MSLAAASAPPDEADEGDDQPSCPTCVATRDAAPATAHFGDPRPCIAEKTAVASGLHAAPVHLRIGTDTGLHIACVEGAFVGVCAIYVARATALDGCVGATIWLGAHIRGAVVTVVTIKGRGVAACAARARL